MKTKARGRKTETRGPKKPAPEGYRCAHQWPSGVRCARRSLPAEKTCALHTPATLAARQARTAQRKALKQKREILEVRLGRAQRRVIDAAYTVVRRGGVPSTLAHNLAQLAQAVVTLDRVETDLRALDGIRDASN